MKNSYHKGEAGALITLLVSFYFFIKWFGAISFLYSLILAGIVFFALENKQFEEESEE